MAKKLPHIENFDTLQTPLQELKGCTVGVIHITGGILFFKNRDFLLERKINVSTFFQSTPENYTLKGLNMGTKMMEGVSIGINKHKICVANTHVITTEGSTYDILCERLINEAEKEEDIPKIVEYFIGQNLMQGGQILVSSPEWTYLVEVFENIFKVKKISRNFVMTNNFFLIPHKVTRTERLERSSINRLEVAGEMIKNIVNIGQLKSMLRSHVPEKGDLSICNHHKDGSGTVSSHIIQVKRDYISWSSLEGYPCENDYNTVQLFLM